MSLPVTVKVAVENTAYSFDKLFDYLIPKNLTEKVRPGCRVLVSFGRGTQKRQGFVFSVSDSPEIETEKLKKIAEVLDEKPLLTDEMIKIASFLADRTFCTYFDAAKSILPSGIYLRVAETFMLSPEYMNTDPEGISAEEQQIVSFLRKKDNLTSDEKIYKALGISPETKLTKKLCEKGILIKNVDTFRRINDAKVKIVSLAEDFLQASDLPFKPTPKQKIVIDLLRNIGSATSKEISYYTGVAQAVIEIFTKKVFWFMMTCLFTELPLQCAIHRESVNPLFFPICRTKLMKDFVLCVIRMKPQRHCFTVLQAAEKQRFT